MMMMLSGIGVALAAAIHLYLTPTTGMTPGAVTKPSITA
jgi:hypothetical protein